MESVLVSFQIVDRIRRELYIYIVAHCVHTADADATKQFRRVGVGDVYWALGLPLLFTHLSGYQRSIVMRDRGMPVTRRSVRTIGVNALQTLRGSSPFLISPPFSFSFISLPTPFLSPLPITQLGSLGERCKLPQRILVHSKVKNEAFQGTDFLYF